MAIHWVKNNATAAGSILFDPIQKHFHSIDFSIYINLLTYSASLITVLIIIQNPFHLHYIFQAFTAVFLVRMICIFLIPLSPAPDMIKLHDPIANFIANENNIFNDLFFSGHIADLTIFYFAIRHSKWRYYLGSCIVLVASMMILQKVHYTADLAMAPFFAYTMYVLFVEKKMMPFFKLAIDGEHSTEQAKNQGVEFFF